MNARDRYELEQIKSRFVGTAYDGKVVIHRVYQLVYMAEHDITPDGTWSDNECDLWSEFRRLIVS